MITSQKSAYNCNHKVCAEYKQVFASGIVCDKLQIFPGSDFVKYSGFKKNNFIVELLYGLQPFCPETK